MGTKQERHKIFIAHIHTYRNVHTYTLFCCCNHIRLSTENVALSAALALLGSSSGTARQR